MSSIFTKIIKREIPANIIYEDEFTIAFLDISQITRGHTLVVPKKECQSLFDIDDFTYLKLMETLKKVVDNVKLRLKISGVNILSNNGVIAGQTVPHLHFHVIPRYTHNEFSINRGEIKTLDKTQLEVLCRLLRF